MIDIHVGPKRKLFRLHKTLLCHDSTYFDNAFNGSFKESKEEDMYLPEDCAETFDLFVSWLYRRDLGCIPKSLGTTEATNRIYRFRRLYVLADKLCINTLKNIALDYLQRLYLTANLVPGSDNAYDSYKSTLAGSPLRRFTAQALAWVVRNHSWAETERNREALKVDPDLAIDVIELLKDVSPIPDPRNPSGCKYHDHADGEVCHLKGEKQMA